MLSDRREECVDRQGAGFGIPNGRALTARGAPAIIRFVGSGSRYQPGDRRFTLFLGCWGRETGPSTELGGYGMMHLGWACVLGAVCWIVGFVMGVMGNERLHEEDREDTDDV